MEGGRQKEDFSGSNLHSSFQLRLNRDVFIVALIMSEFNFDFDFWALHDICDFFKISFFEGGLDL